MNGLVLWFNENAQTGMIWCEDQGPLAFLGPDVDLPNGQEVLSCGDQVTFSVELRDDVRFVRDVYKVVAGVPGSDPQAIIMGYHHDASDDVKLSVVA
jgi:hypothetical protein